MPVSGVRLSITSTAQDILGSLNVPENSSVFVNNSGSNSVFLGGSTVTASGGTTGYELKTNIALSNPIEVSQQTRVYAIAATTGQLDLLIFTPY